VTTHLAQLRDDDDAPDVAEKRDISTALPRQSWYFRKRRGKNKHQQLRGGSHTFFPPPHVFVKAHTVEPPVNLVAQVARHVAGDTSGYRTDWPKPLMKLAARRMRAVHYPGLENRGARWVQLTIKKLQEKPATKA
jgi:hypothetical protein